MTIYLRILYLVIKFKIFMEILDHFVQQLHPKIKLKKLLIILNIMKNSRNTIDLVLHIEFMNHNNFL